MMTTMGDKRAFPQRLGLLHKNTQKMGRDGEGLVKGAGLKSCPAL